jgi:hypothetical protein
MKNLKPIYTEDNTKIIHNLYYDWIGWQSAKKAFPNTIIEAIDKCVLLWRKDGLCLEKWSYSADMVKVLFQAPPNISPFLFSQRIKGRLDHSFSNCCSKS